MRLKRQTYVEFFRNQYGSVHKKVESRDAIKPEDIPLDVYGYQYYDIVTTQVRVDGAEVTLASEPINWSAGYYPDAKLYTADNMYEAPEEFSVIVQALIIIDRYQKVIIDRFGKPHPLDKLKDEHCKDVNEKEKLLIKPGPIKK